MLADNERTYAASTRLKFNWSAVTGVLLLGSVGCLPGFDEDVPSTQPENVSRAALLRLIPGASEVSGAALPLVIEGSVGPTVRGDGSTSPLCVLLWADQGRVTFPFGSGCGVDAGAADLAAHARRCIEVEETSPGWVGGSAVGVYIPESGVERALVVAALYSTIDCSGEAVAEVAVALTLSDHGNSDGTDGGVADSSAPEPGVPDADVPDADSPDTDAPDGGVRDAQVPDTDVPGSNTSDSSESDQSSAVTDGQSTETASDSDGGSDAIDAG